MLRQAAAGLCLCLAVLIGGCGKGDTGEVAVPQVQIAEQPEIKQTEEQEAAALGLETAAGTILGEEEVVLIQEDGTPKSVMYTRVQGSQGVSAAYDPERFTIEAEENGIRFLFLENPAVTVSIREEQGDSAEGLADQYVYDSNEECTVEEVTIGEGEYPAVWVGYAEGTADDERTCDLYILRYNEKLYVVQLDCTVKLYDELGEEQQMILSTLRFDEG